MGNQNYVEGMLLIYGNVVTTNKYIVERRQMLLPLVDLFLIIKTLHKSLINFADSFAL